jgi:hypothetical protein
MVIQVLWIDDEWRKLDALISDAEHDKIKITPFESREKGIEALLRDPRGFHAVILDAKVKDLESDITTGLEGLMASRDKLEELKSQGLYLPYFIFTGQPDYMDSQVFRELFKDYYVKGTDNQLLLDDIKYQVENKAEYLIQSRYKKVFEVCRKHDFLKSAEIRKHLTQILLTIDTPSALFDDEKYFTPIRKIMESIFRLTNQYKLLHDACLEGRVNLNESSLFLAGKDTKYCKVKCAKRHFPKIVADVVRSIVDVAGAAGHTPGPEDEEKRYNLEEYRARVNTPYLLYSLTFQLLDVIIWLDSYLAENPDRESNKSFWTRLEPKSDSGWITGKVTRIAENGFGTFLSDDGKTRVSIKRDVLRRYNLVTDQSITILTTEATINGKLKTIISELKLQNQ